VQVGAHSRVCSFQSGGVVSQFGLVQGDSIGVAEEVTKGEQLGEIPRA
jgi:hypothetical protein